MSKKAQHEPPADDWAGLAQDLFGINLDKPGGDDDLLDDDMFKVEIPPPAEPPTPVAAIESVTFEEVPAAQVAEISVLAPAATPKIVATKPKVMTSPKPVVAKSNQEDDPFGAGILEDVVAGTSEAEDFDDGLTLPEDFDDEGLTLASDFDDGLTLPLEQEVDDRMLSADGQGGWTTPSENAATNEAADDGREVDSEDASIVAGDVTQGARPGRPRQRQPRRTREDAYWDMLENWEWEEIPDRDSPRSDGERSPVRGGRSAGRGGDRGGRGGDRGGRSRDRGGRDERPRMEKPARSDERPQRDDSRSAEAVPRTPRSESGDSAARPRSADRPSDGRSPRSERRPDREERRDKPRQAASSQPAVPPKVSDDFGCGIFEEQVLPVSESSDPTPPTLAGHPRRDEAVAQSSQAADVVMRDSPSRAAGQSLSDDLIWPDDSSDGQPAAVSSVVETSGLPAANVADESDRMESASDVEPLDESEQRSRRPRRRRRRGAPMSERTAPPDGNEGTTFDLSEALSTDDETPGFIPSASADDPALSTESTGERSEDSTGEDRPSERRGSRRRRRRRPGENAPDAAAANSTSEVEANGTTPTDSADAFVDDAPVLKPIAYSNIPSWEEALRYLLEPHLVGRNLGPDDEDQGLASDPRGSGGAEPTAPSHPPPRRRRGGSGGRGRRP